MSDVDVPNETSPLLPKTNATEEVVVAERVDEPSAVENGLTNGSAGPVHVERSTKEIAIIAFPMAIGVFLTALDATIVVASYAAIGSELEELQSASWIATAYMLTITSVQPLFGKLSDIFGRKTCLVTSYLMFGVGTMLCGSARTMKQLIAARAFTGIGGGGMQTLSSIIMSDIVPLRSRGVWQGLMNIVFSSGQSIGAPLGGFLSDSIGWRWAFYIQAPIALLAIISVSIFLRLPPPTSTLQAAQKLSLKAKFQRIDFLGALTLILSILSLLIFLTLVPDPSYSFSSPQILASLVIFVVSGAAFGFVEWRSGAKEPFAPKRIIFNKRLICAFGVNFFGMLCAMPTLFNIALYFQLRPIASSLPSSLSFTTSLTSLFITAADEGGTGHATRAGLLLIPSVICGVSGSLIGGIVIRHTGQYRGITIFAYALQLIGNGAVSVLLAVGAMSVGLGRSVGLLVGVLVALGVTAFGNGTGVTTSLIAIIANAGKEDQAIGTAVSYLFRSLGSVMGLSIASAILQHVLRTGLYSSLLDKVDPQLIEEIIENVSSSLSPSYLSTLAPSVLQAVVGSYISAIRAVLYFSFGSAVLAFGCALGVGGVGVDSS